MKCIHTVKYTRADIFEMLMKVSAMYCERCKNLEATIHLTEIIKDVKSEVHLCESCAREIGLNSKLSNFSLSIPEMLSFLNVDEVDEYATGNVCKTCGLSFLDYSREGKLGCPDCYTYLGESLKSVIAGYHGATTHAGKHPANPAAGEGSMVTNAVRMIAAKKSKEELKIMLSRAVFEERYEEAALLRDKIRELE
jgi:protein arginine kinase activator